MIDDHGQWFRALTEYRRHSRYCGAFFLEENRSEHLVRVKFIYECDIVYLFVVISLRAKASFVAYFLVASPKKQLAKQMDGCPHAFVFKDRVTKHSHNSWFTLSQYFRESVNKLDERIMDHSNSMSAEFDSSSLNYWEEVNEDGDIRQPTESSSEGNGSTSTSSAQSSGYNQSIAQSGEGGITRPPSFPTSVGGALSTIEKTGQNIVSDASAPVAASASNLATAAWQVPMNAGTFNESTVNPMTGTMGFPQYSRMVQYALSGQATGAPFPSGVSFNRKSQDTVSNLSVDTSTVMPTHKSTPSAHLGQSATDQGARTTTQLQPFGIQPSTATTNSLHPYMFNSHDMFACNPELLAAYQVSQLQMAAQQATQAPARPATAPTVLPPVPVAAPEQSPSLAQAAKKPAKAPKSKKSSKTTSNATPPFLLFDAPCELRANFMQTQRLLNLPVHQDNNSYHYGLIVNGFHPQLNASMDPSLLPLSPEADIKLIDSRNIRHSKKGRAEGKERNEREQKRAQKITDLIEQIRLSIEDGGWKVEMKSKHHTLSK